MEVVVTHESGTVEVITAADALARIYRLGVLVPERKILNDWNLGRTLRYGNALYRKARYTVAQSRVWRRDDGLTVGLGSSCPWQSDDEAPRWSLTPQGWCVCDEVDSITLRRYDTYDDAVNAARKMNGVRA